ncbi:hypothetical protein [Chamaesiphon sp.]|uniref:hypothetical protein n=1 Tax=Chamaesiphon sp. TaxID=2814140 RepID=UPI003593526D
MNLLLTIDEIRCELRLNSGRSGYRFLGKRSPLALDLNIVNIPFNAVDLNLSKNISIALEIEAFDTI